MVYVVVLAMTPAMCQAQAMALATFLAKAHTVSPPLRPSIRLLGPMLSNLLRS
jgi:hypothetical protein